MVPEGPTQNHKTPRDRVDVFLQKSRDVLMGVSQKVDAISRNLRYNS